MRTWAVINQKGGAGKSSLCVHLAVHAVAQGEHVLIVDLDPQENAKGWQLRRGEARGRPMVVAAVPENLGKVLKGAVPLGFTLAIIDTAGKIDAVALDVIRISDLIIAPTLPNFFDIEALRGTVELIKQARKIDRAVCVVNGVNARSADRDFSDAATRAADLGISVAPAYCSHRVAFADAIAAGKGVSEFAPKTDKAVKEIAALWKALK